MQIKHSVPTLYSQRELTEQERGGGDASRKRQTSTQQKDTGPGSDSDESSEASESSEGSDGTSEHDDGTTPYADNVDTERYLDPETGLPSSRTIHNSYCYDRKGS